MPEDDITDVEEYTHCEITDVRPTYVASDRQFHALALATGGDVYKQRKGFDATVKTGRVKIENFCDRVSSHGRINLKFWIVVDASEWDA